jgi:hypothetical protein
MNKAEFVLCKTHNLLHYLMIWEHCVIKCDVQYNKEDYIPAITHSSINSMLSVFSKTEAKSWGTYKFINLANESRPKHSKDIKTITKEQYIKIIERLKPINWTYTQEPHDIIVTYRFDDNVWYEYPDKIMEFHDTPNGTFAGYVITY